MTDIENLKALASAACSYHPNDWFSPRSFLQILEKDDADYIAAASPVLVLQLIQKIESMEIEISARDELIVNGLLNAQKISRQYDLDERRATRLGHEIESFEDRLARMMDGNPHREASQAFASVAAKARE